MTIENEQITPADAAIVSSGTGTKGPEERDLPASLKEEMDLCLQILREVLGEFDEKLLDKFDEVREHAPAFRRIRIRIRMTCRRSSTSSIKRMCMRHNCWPALSPPTSIWPTYARRTTVSPCCPAVRPP